MTRSLARIVWGGYVPLLATAALVAVLALSFRYSMTLGSVSEAKRSASSHRSPKGTEELGTDLVLSQVVGGGDIVSVGKVYTRRMRKGPFVLGVREMVIDRLELLLPEEYFNPPATTNAAGTAMRAKSAGASVPDLFGGLTSDKGRFSEQVPAIVGLRVNGLNISRLEGGTNAVSWLQARTGKFSADVGGLVLRDVVLVEGGVTNDCASAVLDFKPCLRIRTGRR